MGMLMNRHRKARAKAKAARVAAVPAEVAVVEPTEAERLEAEKAEADRIEAERVAAQVAEDERLAALQAAPAEWNDLTDEQLAEAYALNVGGNATSRKGQIKALDALDPAAPAD